MYELFILTTLVKSEVLVISFMEDPPAKRRL